MDGSSFRVNFKSGQEATARWKSEWQVATEDTGRWISMKYQHGTEPLHWWPIVP
jgi:hypothetical protein